MSERDERAGRVAAGRGGMSDSEILTRIDAVKTELAGKIDGLADDVHSISQEMAVWRTEFVAKEVYDADERTRAEIRRQLERADEENGTAITDLQAEATRKDRDRRKMWSAIAVAIIAAAAAWLFSLARPPQSSQPIVVCVPSSTQNCQ